MIYEEGRRQEEKEEEEGFKEKGVEKSSET